jgi:hypothetical protein
MQNSCRPEKAKIHSIEFLDLVIGITPKTLNSLKKTDGVKCVASGNLLKISRNKNLHLSN